MIFKCPKCGSAESFTIRGAVEHHEAVDITAYGDVTESSGGDLTWAKSSEISCYECDHVGTVRQFEAAANRKAK